MKKSSKNKLGLLNLAEELGNVSRAYKVMGFSRDTFYRYLSAVEQGGIEALIDQNRRKPNIKNRVDEQTESSIIFRNYTIARLKENNLAKWYKLFFIVLFVFLDCYPKLTGRNRIRYIGRKKLELSDNVVGIKLGEDGYMSSS